jgi:galactose mutarotase-like enzyme
MSQFQGQDIIEIVLGASHLRFAPQAGGRLLSWHVDGAPVIHWPESADWQRPAAIRGGNPLLFPFLGRHRVDGRIGLWRDAQGVAREVPMHGFARDLPFAVDVLPQRDGVRMTLADSDATRSGYPFHFRHEAVYRLADPTTLDVELTTENTGSARLPYYAGHHFYFTLPHAQRGDTVLSLPRNAYRHQRPDGSITAPQAGQTRYTFDDPAIVDRFHCLDGIPQHAIRIDARGPQRVIDIDLCRPGSVPWYAVTTWTEAPESDFYCVEPWLGLPDAIHNGLGLRWLSPGERETAALRIGVRATA